MVMVILQPCSVGRLDRAGMPTGFGDLTQRVPGLSEHDYAAPAPGSAAGPQTTKE